MNIKRQINRNTGSELLILLNLSMYWADGMQYCIASVYHGHPGRPSIFEIISNLFLATLAVVAAAVTALVEAILTADEAGVGVELAALVVALGRALVEAVLAADEALRGGGSSHEGDESGKSKEGLHFDGMCGCGCVCCALVVGISVELGM